MFDILLDDEMDKEKKEKVSSTIVYFNFEGI